MTENATFTPREAARAISEVASYETTLLRRTGGLTWVVWALASPGIFLSYLVAGLVYGPHGMPWYVGAFLWLPWTVAGIVATVALWRSAALSVPRVASKPSWRYLVVGIGMSAVGWLGALLFVPHINPPNYALLAIGTAWTLAALRGRMGTGAANRGIALAMGLTTFAAAVVLAFSIPVPSSAEGLLVASVVGAAVSGGVPLVGGAWLALRG